MASEHQICTLLLDIANEPEEEKSWSINISHNTKIIYLDRGARTPLEENCCQYIK